MLTIDPERRFTLEQIKTHPWLRVDETGEVKLTLQRASIPNCQLTNAILDHAELLGYDRRQVLRSVNGNSYDSDAAIWHLLLEKFQKACQIQQDPRTLPPVSLSKVWTRRCAEEHHRGSCVSRRSLLSRPKVSSTMN